MTKIDLNQYSKFVGAVTSLESSNYDHLHRRINQLRTWHAETFNPSLLLTSVIGITAESGEFAEIAKKIFFQGKPFNDESHFHMKRELGDIFWYWINACRSLDLDPNDVIAENIKKLESRYPSGNFNVFHSENRKEGDL